MNHQRSRIGFIIDGRFPSIWSIIAGNCGILNLFRGYPSNSPMGFMRYGWIADAVNKNDPNLRYELFTPFHKYEGVVFLKSMGKDCFTLARRLKENGVRIVFDANVDYLTPAEGKFYYDGMAPTEAQRQDVMNMIEIADTIIADSEYILQKIRPFHNCLKWIPDNVRMDLVPVTKPVIKQDRLILLWSGASCKVFELLLIASVLRNYAKYIRLILITDDWSSGLERCFEPYRKDIKDLLADLEHKIIPFRSIEQLLKIYGEGDIFISPRFLDNSYNLGHTEWKITLPMACRRFVLASPQPSYVTVQKKSRGKGIRICTSSEEWDREIDNILSKEINLEEEGHQGRQTVESHYSSDVVARIHADMVEKVLRFHKSS